MPKVSGIIYLWTTRSAEMSDSGHRLSKETMMNAGPGLARWIRMDMDSSGIPPQRSSVAIDIFFSEQMDIYQKS